MQYSIGKIVVFAFLFLAISELTQSQVHAQMFGSRGVGGSGMLRGDERFLRGNRSRRDFVGSDRSEQTSFVGAQQAIATGRVRSATDGLRIDSVNEARVNRPIAPQPRTGLYYPRLELDLEPIETASRSRRSEPAGSGRAFSGEVSLGFDRVDRSHQIESRLQERVHRIGGPGVRLTVEDSTATVRGSVDSPKTAELLRQLLSFEPGIDEVHVDVHPK